MTKISDVTELEKQGNIALLVFDSPPVNALGQPVRQGLISGVKALTEDAEIEAMIIVCRGRTFFAGADIKELGKPPLEPYLNDVLAAIEGSTKPIIAAIHGTAFGGGLEAAMTCQFRIAVPSAKFGLPEVKLGIIPGAGGTQRLPRLIGPEKALKMITSGNPIDSGEALETGLIDEIIEGNLEAGAIEFAQKILAEGRPVKRVCEMDEKIETFKGNTAFFDGFRKKNARRFRGFKAPEAAIKAVEAAVNQPINEGLQTERNIFLGLVNDFQAAAQRHYFFAERMVSKIPDIPKDTQLLKIDKVGVIGAGTMGGGIAMNFVNAGIPVTLIETKQEFLDRGLGVIRKNYDITAAKGKMTKEDVDRRMSLLTGSLSMEDLADVDMVVEAVFENMDLKKEIFQKLNRICKSNAILASNTSYLNINEIAAEVDQPEYVVGMHFFSPANVMKLLEVVRGTKTSKSVLATVLNISKKIGKIAAVVGVCHGFAGNRMYSQRAREVNKIILEGAPIDKVDAALYDFGFPMGPFVLSDLVGIDVGWDKKTSSSSSMKEILCEMGRLGQKSGAGYYRYEEGSRKPIPDPKIVQVITDFSKKQNIKQRQVDKEEIVKRCIYPIINEGAKILDERIAVRPSDLDVIWVNGYGWPLYLGGPMCYADQIGLDEILKTLQSYQKEFGEEWKPAPLLEKLASENKTFADLNQ